MRKFTITLFAVLFSTAAFAVVTPVKPAVPVAPKKVDVFKGWKPPLEIQNKGGTAVVPAPVKK